MRLSPYLSSILIILVAISLFSTPISGCRKNTTHNPADSSNTDTSRKLAIYKPQEMTTMNWNADTSQWCYPRSKQSEHFIIFWSKGYGANSPSSANVPAKYRVDIDDLLKNAERIYDYYVNTLKFAVVGNHTSNLDKYKLMIFLFYQDDWLATGLGYDNVIGALWISPNTVQPAGSTIAHEIGHCFQYQVGCDLGAGHGYRWGYGGGGGNTFWEQCAQWQSYELFPQEVFGAWYGEYAANYHKHLLHEDYRYANYFIHYFWTQKRGMDLVARLWRECQQSEDAIQTYQRIEGLTNDQFNDELYDACTRLVTYDLDQIREGGKNRIGSLSYKMNKQSDGSFQPDTSFCPQTTGYNAIPLNVPSTSTTVYADFKGIANAPGYHQVDANLAGWRYGFVALLKDGSRVYGPMYKKNVDTAQFTVPANCDQLWLVVTGAPTQYNQHAWDDDDSNDEQWPYKVTFTNTNVYGYLNDANTPTDPTDVSFDYNISIAHDSVNYASTYVKIDLPRLTNAFQLEPDQISSKMGADIQYYALEPNGNLNSATTANGYGDWFDAGGYVVNWGSSAVIYSEYDNNNYAFTVGQYPGHVKAGDSYKIKQAFVYTSSTGKKAQATFSFTVTIL